MRVVLKGGKAEVVESFGQFSYEISGQVFKFAVTKEVAGLGKVVTHIASGLKVCGVSVGASYLPAFAKKNSDVERALVSLAALIERVGAEKVRSVIATAEQVPTKKSAPRRQRHSGPYLVRYKYNNPGPAGPFKGNCTVGVKPERGAVILAAFGEATVTSFSAIAKAAA